MKRILLCLSVASLLAVSVLAPKQAAAQTGWPQGTGTAPAMDLTLFSTSLLGIRSTSSLNGASFDVPVGKLLCASLTAYCTNPFSASAAVWYYGSVDGLNWTTNFVTSNTLTTAGSVTNTGVSILGGTNLTWRFLKPGQITSENTNLLILGAKVFALDFP
jgi:hypothetical protein